MYDSERQMSLVKEYPAGFDEVAAGEIFGEHLAGIGTDNLLELTRAERERIFNLGYFTWVEQQGLSVEEFRSRHEAGFWEGIRPDGGRLGRDDPGLQRPHGRAPAAVSLHQATLPSMMVCRGCGSVVDAAEPYPFTCPNAGDGTDHVLRRVLDTEVLVFPDVNGEHNPFVGFRSLMHSQHLAVAGGMTDDAYVRLVCDLDDAVAKVDGHGFATTPISLQVALAERCGHLGPLYVKDETGNVSGSHKGRHLFGLGLHLAVVEHLGLADAAHRRPLAIASCGNAALAAAVVAAAGERKLLVFVPADADPAVVARLSELGARITVCEREEGSAGDPTYHRMRAAIAEGAIPFTCQGNENGLAIEGGETLGYELVAHLAATDTPLDHIVVQVGEGRSQAPWRLPSPRPSRSG